LTTIIIYIHNVHISSLFSIGTGPTVSPHVVCIFQRDS